MNQHVMITVGSAPEGRCGACGGVWVKNLAINPYNRMPNWKNDTGDYQTQECTGKNFRHVTKCNCRDCCEK